MIAEEQKYIAEIFKIGGFAFIAPFGKVVLGIPYFRLIDITIESLLTFALTFSLAIIGIMLIHEGIKLLRIR